MHFVVMIALHGGLGAGLCSLFVGQSKAWPGLKLDAATAQPPMQSQIISANSCFVTNLSTMRGSHRNDGSVDKYARKHMSPLGFSTFSNTCLTQGIRYSCAQRAAGGSSPLSKRTSQFFTGRANAVLESMTLGGLQLQTFIANDQAAAAYTPAPRSAARESLSGRPSSSAGPAAGNRSASADEGDDCSSSSDDGGRGRDRGHHSGGRDRPRSGQLLRSDGSAAKSRHGRSSSAPATEANLLILLDALRSRGSSALATGCSERAFEALHRVVSAIEAEMTALFNDRDTAAGGNAVKGAFQRAADLKALKRSRELVLELHDVARLRSDTQELMQGASEELWEDSLLVSMRKYGRAFVSFKTMTEALWVKWEQIVLSEYWVQG